MLVRQPERTDESTRLVSARRLEPRSRALANRGRGQLRTQLVVGRVDIKGMDTTEIATERCELGELVVRVEGPQGPGGEARLASAVLRPGAAMFVGSGPRADLSVAEPTVSQRHVRLEHRGSHVVATDLGSKNGTTLFGHTVTAAHLGPGAMLGLGRARLHVVTRAVDQMLEEPLAGVVGRSRVMIALAQRVRRFAALDEPVLVRGESGTGKELVARALHDSSVDRAKGPFIAINAASFSRELAESELFGHRRGAFTGALADRRGAFREASGGTLFIDEIAQLGIEVQAKLLRVVEEGSVRPLGSDGTTKVDVRLVAATCEPLEEYVASRRFRPDLYQRIAVCVVKVPALSERRSDVPDLAAHLLRKLGFSPMQLTPCAVSALTRAQYPGNVRELRSVLLHAALAAGPRGEIEERHVIEALVERGAAQSRPSAEEAMNILAACGGNRSAAARLLRLPRSTLRDLVARARPGRSCD